MRQDTYKWHLLFLLWIACFIQQGMRQIFPPLAKAIGENLHLSPTSLGAIMSTFLLSYAILVPIAGILSIFNSRKKIVIFSLATFSTGVLLAGFQNSLTGLILFYGITNGFGQSFFYPAATSLIDQHHENSKATALSILQLSLYLGVILISFTSGKLLDIFASWRPPFKLFGTIGILWAFILCFTVRDTKQQQHFTQPSVRDALKIILKTKSVLFLAGAICMQIFVDNAVKTWMPTYLSAQFPGHTSASYGLHAVLWHYLGAFIGVIIGSRIADKFVKIRPKIRIEINLIGLLFAIPFIILMTQAPTLILTNIYLFCFGIFRGIYDSNQFASIFDIIPPRYRSLSVGLILSIAFSFSAISPILLGALQAKLTLGHLLSSLAIFYLIATIFALIAKKYRPISHF